MPFLELRKRYLLLLQLLSTMRGYLAAGRTWHILALWAIALFFLFLAAQAEPSRMVDAGEILKKIELGQPVQYDNVVVTGDLDLSGLNAHTLPAQRTARKSSAGRTVVASPIRITDSVILNDVNFDNAILENVTDFQGTKFISRVSMSDARFNDLVNFNRTEFGEAADFSLSRFGQLASFSYAQFNQTAIFIDAFFGQEAIFVTAQFNQIAYFQRTQFRQYADIRSVTFNRGARFEAAQFNRTANFKLTRFLQDADFRKSRFLQDASFSNAQFNQTAIFIDAFFGQEARFVNAQFNQNAYFQRAQFRQYADIKGARFNRGVNFGYAQFNQTADFKQVQFLQDADFESSQFNQTADFRSADFNQESNFDNATIQNAIFNDSQFSQDVSFDEAKIGKLSLTGSDLEKLDIRWSSIEDLAYDDSAYNLLRKNLDTRGYLDDASECQYSYRCKHRADLWRQGNLGLWSLDFLAWASYGYGLKPQRPLYWSISIILLGGLFFFSTRSVVRSSQCPGPSENKSLAASDKGEETPGSVSIWESLLLSATYFTSGASSIISAAHTEIVPVGRGRYVVVLLRLLGWIFFVIFLSSLTKVV